MGNLTSIFLKKNKDILAYDEILKTYISTNDIRTWSLDDKFDSEVEDPQHEEISCADILSMREIASLLTPFELISQNENTVEDVLEYFESNHKFNYYPFVNYFTKDERKEILRAYILQLKRASQDLKRYKKYLSHTYVDATLVKYSKINNFEHRKLFYYNKAPKYIINDKEVDFGLGRVRNLERDFKISAEERKLYRGAAPKIEQDQAGEDQAGEDQAGEDQAGEDQGANYEAENDISTGGDTDDDIDEDNISISFPNHPYFQAQKQKIIHILREKKSIYNFMREYDTRDDYEDASYDEQNVISVFNKMKNMKNIEFGDSTLFQCKNNVVKALWSYKYVHDMSSLIEVLDIPFDFASCETDVLREYARVSTENLKKPSNDIRFLILKPFIYKAVKSLIKLTQMKERVWYVSKFILQNMNENISSYCKLGDDNIDNRDEYEDMISTWKKFERKGMKTKRILKSTEKLVTKRIDSDDGDVESVFEDSIKFGDYVLVDDIEYVKILDSMRIRIGDVVGTDSGNFERVSGKTVDFFVSYKNYENDEDFDAEIFRNILNDTRCQQKLQKRLGAIENFDGNDLTLKNVRFINTTFRRLDSFINQDKYASLKDLCFPADSVSHAEYLRFKKDVVCLGRYLSKNDISCYLKYENEENYESGDEVDVSADEDV